MGTAAGRSHRAEGHPLLRFRDQSKRLERESYPRRCDHPLLFSDLDAFGHLNNGATARFFEEGRQSVNRSAFHTGTFPVLVQVCIEYLAEGQYPGLVTACTAIRRTGATSLVFAHAAFQADVCIALAEATMVRVQAGAPVPLSSNELAALRAFETGGLAFERDR